MACSARAVARAQGQGTRSAAETVWKAPTAWAGGDGARCPTNSTPFLLDDRPLGERPRTGLPVIQFGSTGDPEEVRAKLG